MILTYVSYGVRSSVSAYWSFLNFYLIIKEEPETAKFFHLLTKKPIDPPRMWAVALIRLSLISQWTKHTSELSFNIHNCDSMVSSILPFLHDTLYEMPQYPWQWVRLYFLIPIRHNPTSLKKGYLPQNIHARSRDQTTAISSISRDFVSEGSIVALLLSNSNVWQKKKNAARPEALSSRGSDSRSEGLVVALLVQLPPLGFATS